MRILLSKPTGIHVRRTDMEQTLYDFIKDLFTLNDMPIHFVKLPCQDWDSNHHELPTTNQTKQNSTKKNKQKNK